MFVILSLVDHCVDMPGEDFPGLYHHGPITLLQLLVNGKSALDGGRGNDLFNRIVRGKYRSLIPGARVTRASHGGFHGSHFPWRDLYAFILGRRATGLGQSCLHDEPNRNLC
jgi:hypothetical protein